MLHVRCPLSTAPYAHYNCNRRIIAEARFGDSEAASKTQIGMSRFRLGVKRRSSHHDVSRRICSVVASPHSGGALDSLSTLHSEYTSARCCLCTLRPPATAGCCAETQPALAQHNNARSHGRARAAHPAHSQQADPPHAADIFPASTRVDQGDAFQSKLHA